MSIGKILLVVVIVGVCVGLSELIAYGVKVLVLGLLAKLRKHKRDRRIIRQAKAAGAWDKPEVLGGRALELKAWQDYKITRICGETDARLRIKYKAAKKKEIQKKLAAATQVPLEIIAGEEAEKMTKRFEDINTSTEG